MVSFPGKKSQYLPNEQYLVEFYPMHTPQKLFHSIILYYTLSIYLTLLCNVPRELLLQNSLEL